jgi:TPR repeat protein
MSVKQKNPGALYKLGRMHEFGVGVQANWKRSISLLEMGAKLGNVEAQMIIGTAHINRGSPFFFPPKGLKYLEMAASQNQPDAYYVLATLYLEGREVQQDFLKAFTLFKKAEELQFYHAKNIFNIPIDYHTNDHIDYQKLIRMFTVISEKNIAALEYNLAIMHGNTLTFEYANLLRKRPPDYQKSKEWCEIAAKNGNAEAQYFLGVIYEEGKGTERDIPKSIEWYTKASENNNANSSYKLAWIYLIGEHLSQNLRKAFQFFKRASDMGHMESTGILNMNIKDEYLEQTNRQTIIEMLQEGASSGNITAQFTLGLHYLNSHHHTDGNFSEEIRWFTMASKGGYSKAFYQLGQIYEDSHFELQDCEEAIRLYHIAASKGNEDALYRIARIYHRGQGVVQRYSKAFYYYVKAAEQGNILSKIAVNIEPISVWEEDKKEKTDMSEYFPFQYGECFKMWEAVAELGDPNIQYRLGLVYEQDKSGLELSIAHSWYIKAAENSHKDALYRLGQFYAKGWGVEKDYTLSMECYQKSAIIGNIDALYQLGFMYENGQGVAPDNETAISYYNRASELGNSESQFRLGTLYEEGLLLQQDILESLRYYARAASQGNEKSYGHLLLLDIHGSTDNYFLERRFYLFCKLCDETIEDTREKTFLGFVHYELGLMYFDGLGTPINYKKAWRCFKRAASVYGEKNAQAFSPVKYQNIDTSVNHMYLKKIKMWETIADQIVKEKRKPIKEAWPTKKEEEELLTKDEKYELGLIYYYGVYANSQSGEMNIDNRVVGFDYVKAQKYFKAATSKKAAQAPDIYKGSNIDGEAIAKHKAKLCYIHSSYYLGMIHCAEMIYTSNDSQALYYLGYAARGNHPNAQELLDLITHGQSNQTMFHKSVFDYLVSNTDLNDKTNDFYIGWMYLKGLGTPENYEKAFDYLTRAAKLSHLEAQFRLGMLYQKFPNPGKEYETAIQWLNRAAHKNHIEANYALGTIYANDKGNRNRENRENLEADFGKALEYFRVAANQGHSDAQFQAGKLCKYIFRNQKNNDEGNMWITKAAEQDHAEAMFNLWTFYFQGYGVERNRKKAFTYLEKSASLGFVPALHQLGVQYEQGIETEIDGKKAFEYFKEAADKNHPMACYDMGNLYSRGLGVEKNFEKAFSYYKVSADQGHPGGQAQLGNCYENGQGTAKNLAEAINWYSKAADKKDTIGNYNLGQLYFHGKGVHKDHKIAFNYFKVSADEGYTDAQYQLGNCYEDGQGTERNITEAIHWYSKAADQNHATANYNLGLMYSHGKGIDKDPKRAFRYYTVAAGQGHMDAQFQLGSCYENGEGTGINIIKSINWYSKAADQNHTVANYHLGQIYVFSDTVDKDYKKAFTYYKVAADQGFADAQMQVGNCYKNGQGIEKSIAEAIIWYSKAADQKHTLASYNLATMYLCGEGVEKEHKGAFNYFKVAAEQGYPEAQFQLGYCFEKGQGIEKDLGEATNWYKKAADQNNPSACYRLGLFCWNGKGVDVDFETAILYFTTAAEQGNQLSQVMLGLGYFFGLGTMVSFPTAMGWFLRAAKKKLASANYISQVSKMLRWCFYSFMLFYNSLINFTLDLFLWHSFDSFTPNYNTYYTLFLWLLYSLLYLILYSNDDITPSLFLLLFNLIMFFYYSLSFYF